MIVELICASQGPNTPPLAAHPPPQTRHCHRCCHRPKLRRRNRAQSTPIHHVALKMWVTSSIRIFSIRMNTRPSVRVRIQAEMHHRSAQAPTAYPRRRARPDPNNAPKSRHLPIKNGQRRCWPLLDQGPELVATRPLPPKRRSAQSGKLPEIA